jgi:uncharacterized repeat protein (TIGR01451 family)
MVEFALVLPIMLFLMAIAIDFGRLFYAYVAVENAAKEGALYGSQNPVCATSNAALCPDPQNVTWRVLNEADNLPGIQVSGIECRERASGTAYGDLRSCKDGDTYVVRTSYDFQLITPILGAVLGNSVTLSSESQSKVLNEAFDPTPGAAVLKYACVDSGTGCTPVQTPTIDANDQPVYLDPPPMAGDTIRYRITVTNIGGQVLTGATIADTFGALPFGTAACPALPGTFARNQSWSCEYTRTAPNPPGGNPDALVSNTVTFDAAEIEPVPQTAIVKVLARPAELLVTNFVNVFQDGGDGDGTPGGFGNATALTLVRPANGNPSGWHWLIVTNPGGQAATGVDIRVNGSAPAVTATCPAPPASLAPGGGWYCKVRESFGNGFTGDRTLTVAATATNVAPIGGHVRAATITVRPTAACQANERVVPDMLGLTKANATSAWSGAGFSGALTTWNGQNSALAVTQNRSPFTCLAQASGATVTRTPTP